MDWVQRFGTDAGRAPVNHKPVLERSCTARCLGWAPGGWSVCVRPCLRVAQRCRVRSGPCHVHGRAGGGGVLGSLTHSCRRVPVRGLGWSGVSAVIRARCGWCGSAVSGVGVIAFGLGSGAGRPLSLSPKAATWLILPVVICLSQRLSHACLSINCLYCKTANGSLNQL